MPLTLTPTYNPITQVACLMEQYNGDAAGGAALRALLDDFQAIGLRLGLGLGLATARVRVSAS